MIRFVLLAIAVLLLGIFACLVVCTIYQSKAHHGRPPQPDPNRPTGWTGTSHSILFWNSSNFNVIDGGTVGSGFVSEVGNEFASSTLFPSNAMLKNLRVRLSSSPGSGSRRLFVLRVNGAPTALSVSIQDNEIEAVNSIVQLAIPIGSRLTLSSLVALGDPSPTTCEASCEYSLMG